MTIDARWIDVCTCFDSAIRHFEMSGKIIDKSGFEGNRMEAYLARMALMHAIQAGYTSFEDGLKKIFAITGEVLPSGGDCEHVDLLKRAARDIHGYRSAVLTPEVYRLADKVRRAARAAATRYDEFDIKDYTESVYAAMELAQVIKQDPGGCDA